ncbi:MAG: NADH:flavin oxidoreductase/NADH oxidase family protein [Alphaproteobacteria bacterium]|nr:NADH:flavin oxidoreductase/NADH oxidase family protein [Alphaproteobacteria bacterium]
MSHKIQLGDPLILPCGAVLPNRLCKSAMTEGLADERNSATSRHAALYKAWADGGIGLSITGNVMVDRRYLERPGNIAIEGPQSDSQRGALSAMAEAGQSDGGHIWMQISHAGRQSPKSVATEPVAPSAIGEVALPGGLFAKPRALTSDEIQDVIIRFAHTAGIAKACGFTGVQIHSAHGYLLSEFLNPLINQREDEWGGSLENRARLLLEVIAAVRAEVGSEFPIGVKLNSSDFQKGGFTLDDCIAVVGMLEAAGVDLVEISGGNYEQPALLGIEGLEPVYKDEAAVKASTKAREAYFLNYAAAIRVNTSIPLMVTGGFRTRGAMLDALNDDNIQMIGLARPLCVEPDLPEALIEGEIDQLTSYENQLSIGPGWFGPGSSNATMRAMNGFAVMAFFYRNIIRMADGLPTRRSMNLLAAFIKHQMTDADDAKKLQR